MQTKVTRPKTTYTAEDPSTSMDTDLLDQIDDWLDAIDEALGDEVNFAEVFWKNWIQKGGQ